MHNAKVIQQLFVIPVWLDIKVMELLHAQHVLIQNVLNAVLPLVPVKNVFYPQPPILLLMVNVVLLIIVMTAVLFQLVLLVLQVFMAIKQLNVQHVVQQLLTVFNVVMLVLALNVIPDFRLMADLVKQQVHPLLSKSHNLMLEQLSVVLLVELPLLQSSVLLSINVRQLARAHINSVPKTLLYDIHISQFIFKSILTPFLFIDRIPIYQIY